MEFLMNKPLQKIIIETIIVNREKMPDKPKFDKYFKGIEYIL